VNQAAPHTVPGNLPNPLPVLDLDAALEHTGGDRELLQQLCSVFAEECPRQLEEVRAAVQSQVPRTIQRAAHKIKGSASVVGGIQASQAAQQLELAAGTEDMARIMTSFELLCRAINDLQSSVVKLEKDIDGHAS
jgi:HPt (histidine-containing phosphotransfer) domain-containing protein